jgi:hypothetical protein
MQLRCISTSKDVPQRPTKVSRRGQRVTSRGGQRDPGLKGWRQRCTLRTGFGETTAATGVVLISAAMCGPVIAVSQAPPAQPPSESYHCLVARRPAADRVVCMSAATYGPTSGRAMRVNRFTMTHLADRAARSTGPIHRPDPSVMSVSVNHGPL